MRSEDINSLESESGVIATLIHHPDYIYQSEQLLPNHFTNKENRCVYTAIYGLVTQGIKTIDSYNIIECLRAKEATRAYSEELTIEGLQELIEMSDVLARPTIEEYKMLVSNILDASFRRDAYQGLKECQGLCWDTSVEDLQKKIYNVIDDVMLCYSTVSDVPEFGQQVDTLWEQIEEHQDGRESGIPFKFPTLNEFVTIEKGELVVLGAPPKGAKSMFMLNEAVDLLKRGKSVFYIDSELSSRLFLCRLLSHLTGVEFNRIRKGRYTPEEKARILEAKEWVKTTKFIHLYMPIFDQNAIYTSVKKAMHKFGGLDVLMVDYLKSTGDTDAYSTYAELGKLTDMIKNDIAGAMDIAAIAAAQLNTNNNKLADSAKIARNASTIVLMLDKTPDEVLADGLDCGNKKFIVQLNRNGMQHTQGEYIDLKFDGNIISLEEAKQHIPVSPY